MVNAYFLDTSALVKKYMTESGSTWIEILTDPETYTFVSADNRLINAAQAEGLNIENPNNHP